MLFLQLTAQVQTAHEELANANKTVELLSKQLQQKKVSSVLVARNTAASTSVAHSLLAGAHPLFTSAGARSEDDHQDGQGSKQVHQAFVFFTLLVDDSRSSSLTMSNCACIPLYLTQNTPRYYQRLL